MNIKFDVIKKCVIIDGIEYFNSNSIPRSVSYEMDSHSWVNILLFFRKSYYEVE